MAQMMLFAGTFAPLNWMYCNGQLLPISQYSPLFALIGTIYGGDGQTSFALPDLQGRTPIGYGQGPGLSDYELGQKSGSNSVTLTYLNLPPHSHASKMTVSISTGNGTTNQPGGNIPASSTAPVYAPISPNMGSLGGVSAAMDSAGSSEPVEIQQPYLAMSFVICVDGIFPSRS